MEISRLAIIGLTVVAVVLGQACRPAPSPPPELPTPQRPLYVVIEEERFVVVEVPGAPRIPRERLLWLAEQVHEDGGARGTTVVVFRDPRASLPNRKLGRGEQIANAFAIGRVDADGVKNLRTGVFN